MDDLDFADDLALLSQPPKDAEQVYHPGGNGSRSRAKNMLKMATRHS